MKHSNKSLPQKILHSGQSIGAWLIAFILLPSIVLGAEKKIVKSDDKQALESVVKKFVHAWNQNDLDTLASLFSTDGQLVSPSGAVTRTRPEIKKRIAKERENRLRDTTVKETVESVQLLKSDNAVIRGKYSIDGVQLALGLKKSFQGPFILRLAKQNNGWTIAKADVSRKRATSSSS